MRRAVFGQPVTALDVERLGPADVDFVRLCGALIAAALAERVGSFVLPAITERVNVPDGGVDASYTSPAALAIDETGGLVGPGTTDYQFKSRDATARPRGALAGALVQQLRRDLARAPLAGNRYVLMTNLDLSRRDRERLREAVRAHPSLMSRTIVIWGAAEIAQALNAVPRLRHIFFSQGGLCSLDTAEDELRAAYKQIAWPDFVGRDEERRTIEAFVSDPSSRYLEVVGGRYTGRTRLVIEALRARGAAVVWASEPGVATLDLIRDLDSHDTPGLLVVDACTPAALRAIQDLALSRQRLKTIAVGTGGEREPWPKSPMRLVVGRLSHEAAASLVRSVLPRVPRLQESWVIEVAGGVPGLILQVAALLRDGAVSPASDPQALQRRLGELIVAQYTASLSRDAREALEVASVLSAVGVEGTVGREVDDVCHALGVEPRTFGRARDELEDLGFLRRRGRFVEVVPPRLADEVAARTVFRSRAAFPELMLRLTEPAFRRLLERLRSLPGDTARKIGADVLGPGGWFPDLPALCGRAAWLRALVPVAPGDALRCLERLLGPLSASELQSQVTGDLRRAVVSALDELALGSRTFGGAARLLLALAEAENENYGNNATGTFVSVFHWNHPEVAAPLALRVDVLEDGARSVSAGRRVIAAKACSMTFNQHASVLLHHAEGAAVPEEPGRPGTWDDVRDYGVRVLSILDRLLADGDAEVERESVASLLEVLQPFVRLSLLPGGPHPLGISALETVARVAGEATSARRRADVVTRLELIDANLCDLGDTVPDVAARPVRDRVVSLIESLTVRTPKDRLWRWVGPRSWSQEVDEGIEERAAREIRSVAAELSASPDALDAQMMSWLVSEEAEHRSSLFHELGARDRGQRLLELLLADPGDQFWAQVVAAYFRGWHETEPEAAGKALDALIASRPDLSAGSLAATVSLPPSPATAQRLRQIIAHGRILRPDLARQVAFGIDWGHASAAELSTLIELVDDGTPETRLALLFVFRRRLVRGAEMTPRLESMAWAFLESTLPMDEGRVREPSWDSVAAKLGGRDSKRLVALFERLIRESMEAGRHRFHVSEDLPLTWKTLLGAERQGVLRSLLAMTLVSESPYWLDWTLSRLIRPDEDLALLIEFAERAGIDGARAVASVLDGGRQGFWQLTRHLLSRWGEDETLADRLAGRVMSGAWTGSAVPTISERIEAAQGLISDHDPRVVRWAEKVVAALREWRTAAARDDREEWIWDQPIRRAEFEGLLDRKDAPERLWAIGRLLEDAPEDRVRDLLSAEDILEALPKLGDLDERARQKWEGWARHWRRSG